MRIKFHKSIPEKDQRYLKQVFDLACVKLGIAEYDRTLYVAMHDGNIPGEPTTTRGLIGPTGKLFECNRDSEGFWSPRKLACHLQIDNFWNMTVAFVHELVHLKQWTIGQLSVRLDEDETPQICWNKIMILNSRQLSYEHQPWEHEAHEKMWRLAREITNQMDKEKAAQKQAA
jgi:hypothetical protein